MEEQGRHCVFTFRYLCSLHLFFLYLPFNFASSYSSPLKYTPADNYLINCGSPESTLLEDGRNFKSDPESASFLSSDENILTSVHSIPNSASSPSSSLPLYLTARIFKDESIYRFLIFKPGRHWLRLYFYPLSNPTYNLNTASFSVTTDSTVLLHHFSDNDNTTLLFKEYLVNITSNKFSLKFSPVKNSIAFINAIELVSATDDLISDSASAISPAGDFNGLSDYAFEVSYRFNIGGPMITPKNDTLGRTWLFDTQFMKFPQGARNVSVNPDSIKYPEGGVTPLIASNWVYSTAYEMADPGVANTNFNLTWVMPVDSSFSYLIRMHFCDIVSKGLNELYFNVYLNGMLGISSLDLSTLASGLAVPYYKDFVVNASTILNGSLMVQVGPASIVITSLPNPILNGLEVMKISNLAGSLDGLFSSKKDPNSGPSSIQIAATVALAMAVALVLLLIIRMAWGRRRPQSWNHRRGSFSSWLLPLNASQCSFLSAKSKSSNSSFISSGIGVGRYFSLNDLREATKNFDENAVIGVGGFGKVYLGELEDGTKLAIKRGNPRSGQGINEFQTEIQMLSKLRHRHLVSLIGYCDEQSEMILVYQYMANGPLRDHLYGPNFKSNLPFCHGGKGSKFALAQHVASTTSIRARPKASFTVMSRPQTSF
ncbi:Non-specific serine/threonine protein kinase [Bertholletia excelsa]